MFGCPAHDQRDLDFAIKYKLPVKAVVKPIDEDDNFKVGKEAYLDSGVIFNSDILNGFKAPDESIIKTIEILEKRKLGKKKINFRLKTGVSQGRDTRDVQFQSPMTQIIMLLKFQKNNCQSLPENINQTVKATL